MEFSNTLAVTVVDIIPSEIEDVQRMGSAYFCQCLSDFGNLLMFLISFCVLVALPIIEFIIGTVYFHECSMNTFIPIYLIVAGLISSIILIFVILGVEKKTFHRKSLNFILFFSGFLFGH
jgi:hypothetical protein